MQEREKERNWSPALEAKEAMEALREALAPTGKKTMMLQMPMTQMPMAMSTSTKVKGVERRVFFMACSSVVQGSSRVTTAPVYRFTRA